MTESKVKCGNCGNPMRKSSDNYVCDRCVYKIPEKDAYCLCCQSIQIPFKQFLTSEIVRDTGLVSCTGSLCSNISCPLYKIKMDGVFIDLYYNDTPMFSLDNIKKTISVIIPEGEVNAKRFTSLIKDENRKLGYFIRKVIDRQILNLLGIKHE